MSSRQRSSEQNILLGIEKDFLMAKGSSCHKDITTLNIHAPKSKASKYTKQKWADLQETENPPYISYQYPFCNN